MNYEEKFPVGSLFYIRTYPGLIFEVVRHFTNTMFLHNIKRNMTVSVKYTKYGTLFWEVNDGEHSAPRPDG